MKGTVARETSVIWTQNWGCNCEVRQWEVWVITEIIAKWYQLLQRWLQSDISYYRDDYKVISVITEMTAKWYQLLQRLLQSKTSYYIDDCKVILVITEMAAERGASYYGNDCRERCQLLQMTGERCHLLKWRLQRELTVITGITAKWYQLLQR